MSLANDLLELAKKLVKYKKADLLDARLRRAVSTAYYALFHLLLESGAARMVKHAGVRHLVARAFIHNEMYKTAKSFASGTGGLPNYLTKPFGNSFPPTPTKLIEISKTFVNMQDARHQADYDLASRFSRSDALGLVNQTEQAFADWNVLSKDPNHGDLLDLFLAAMLLGERLKR